MASTTSFSEAIAIRRSAYALTNSSKVPQSRIREVVYDAIKYCPSAFNVRSSRCIILFGDEHIALWDHATEVTPKAVSKELYDLLVPRIGIFKAAYGTVLFFEDPAVIKELPTAFHPLFDEYPEVQEHASGMLQFIVWTALAAEGLGCNLQHYQPGITAWVKDRYNIPATWELKAQLVFGDMTAGPGEEKPRTHLDKALEVYGGDR